ncbi:MAG: coenzyme F420-0:L-glutamate ligase, partial [Thermoleophilaceae bacterium]|nr:coenzyme F420-0:L-glutamate ligase [Thermoleophilaceae bacterium]
MITACALAGIPEIHAGDDLVQIAADALATCELAPLQTGDVLVFAQKVVSKAEGQTIALSSLIPSTEAIEIAEHQNKDPRHVQVVLDESQSLLRKQNGVLICETKHGFVCANAGVDASNVPADDSVLLLPVDPDASARQLRAGVSGHFGVQIGVIIADSFGRAWRLGQADVAIGCAGLLATADARGTEDRNGRELGSTEIAIADEIASAADLTRS